MIDLLALRLFSFVRAWRVFGKGECAKGTDFNGSPCPLQSRCNRCNETLTIFVSPSGDGTEIYMAKISRQEAREKLFELLFETEFRSEEDLISIYERACEDREIPDDKYIRQSFFGIRSKLSVVDAVIGKYSKGWRADRLSKVSRTVIRIAVYEMLFLEDIPMNVSISQAVELSIRYGEDKAKQFVNGVLSGLFKDVQAQGADAVITAALAEADATKQAPVEETAEEAPVAAPAEEADGENA